MLIIIKTTARYPGMLIIIKTSARSSNYKLQCSKYTVFHSKNI
jgi:hypothetical protein